MNELATTESEIERILSVKDDDALEEALAAVPPAVAARAVAVAPGLERKTELLWAMEDRQRREVLDRVPPSLIGALVQNLEDDNRYLLGDVSFEQFRGLLSLCSPERQFYWLGTALSFTDVRANALPLLIPTRELTEVLLTRSEFEEHLRSMADFPIEDQRLPPELMRDPAQTLVDLFGPENLLRQFPLKDAGVAQLVQNMLDHDPDRYVDIIREGLRLLDYTENRPLEYETLVEAPILLDLLEPAPEGAVEVGAPPAEVEPIALVPVSGSILANAIARLAPEERMRVGAELQQAIVRQAVAEGGSFLLADLQRVARSVEAYLMLGLMQDPAEIGSRPVNKWLQAGARVLETDRQEALRIEPLAGVLDVEGRALVESFVRPRLTVDASGDPRLKLLPAGNLPADLPLTEARHHLLRLVWWTRLARGMGLKRTEAALKEAGSIERLEEELAIGAVLYSRVEPGLAEPADRRRFLSRYLENGELRQEAWDGLERAIEAWAGTRRDPHLAVDALTRAMKRLAASDETG